MKLYSAVGEVTVPAVRRTGKFCDCSDGESTSLFLVDFSIQQHLTEGQIHSMAQQMTVTYLDDLDGGKAAETVAFGLDGASYEMDLSAKNAKNLRKALAEFVEAARKVKPASPVAGGTAGRGQRKTSRDKQSGRTQKSDSNAIRAWANDNGISISARGRIPASVQEQYAAAATAAAGDDAAAE